VCAADRGHAPHPVHSARAVDRPHHKPMPVPARQQESWRDGPSPAAKTPACYRKPCTHTLANIADWALCSTLVALALLVPLPLHLVRLTGRLTSMTWCATAAWALLPTLHQTGSFPLPLAALRTQLQSARISQPITLPTACSTRASVCSSHSPPRPTMVRHTAPVASSPVLVCLLLPNVPLCLPLRTCKRRAMSTREQAEGGDR
jgi:hypothetical protein